MTPPTTDEQWLEHLLVRMLPDMDDKYIPITRKEAKAAIRKRLLEARIDELEKLKMSGTSYGFGETFAIGNKDINDRKAQLREMEG